MTVIAVLPDSDFQSIWEQVVAYLTLIVPASDGCNLECPYCYIDQRKEGAEMI